MIKQLSIKNFESHEDTTINFQEGFNLIVGKSNSGKSSIIRALNVIVNNDWDKEMVRNGCEFCFVRVVTDKGIVEVERGEKVNRWKCQELNGEVQSFKNVGTNVPDLATKILGMGERDRGNDIKELPNFQFQLEKHYMLSEIGEKKATSNLIARMMDNAIGLGGMEDLIKAISTDLAKDKKWLTEKQNEITSLKSEIIDDIIFDKHQTMVDKISSMFTNIEEIEDNINRADVYLRKYNNIEEKKILSDKNLAKLKNVDNFVKYKKELENLKNKITLFEKIYSINKNLTELSKKRSIDVENLKKRSDEINKLQKILNLLNKYKKNEEAKNLLQEVLSIDVEKLKDTENQCRLLKEKITNAESILKKSRDIWTRRARENKNILSIDSDLKNIEKEFHEFKEKIGVCPLCGEKLK